MKDDMVALWKKLRSNLKTFILKRVGNEDDAEDILQDVFLKIFTNLDRLKDESRIYAWVYQITRNAINDYFREKMKKIYEGISNLPGEGVPDNGDDEVAGSEEKGDEIITELALCLKNMIKSLPDKYRDAIVLTELCGLTQRELAQRLGISISGVKSRVQRGRSMLKEKLLDCCEFQLDKYGNVIEYQHKETGCKYC